MFWKRAIGCAVCFVCAVSGLMTGEPAKGGGTPPDVRARASRILSESGVKGGLVVHLGCGEGTLTAALCADDSFRVHGLDEDSADIKQARRHIRSLRLDARASVEQWGGRNLPYVDNLVDLVVCDEPLPLHMDEVMRVLSPHGVAYVKQGDRWVKRMKPWPDDIDDWTHYLHDASGNAVARDTRVAPPRHYQWTASPAWSRHHDTVLTTSAMVTAGGRIFAIMDNGPSSEFHDREKPNWSLVARDAFNGVLLWERGLEKWGWQAWGKTFKSRFAQPVQLPKRLVALQDRIYTTLSFHAPVSKLDAATGEVLRTFESTQCADELVLHGGVLLATVYDPERDPSKKGVCAVNPESGELLWTQGPYDALPARYDAVEGEDPVYLTAHEDRVVFVSRGFVRCLELETGEERWRVPRPDYPTHKMNLGVRMSENCSLVNQGNVVLFTQPGGQLRHTAHTVPCDLYAFDADTGERLWERKIGIWAWGHQADAFAIGDLVWVHEHIPTEMRGPDPAHLESLKHELLALDVQTGNVQESIPTNDIFQIRHHHRCYRNKATTNYILTARRGTEFTNLDSGEIRLHPWTRGECRLGIMPANGLLYTPPHPCQCYAGVLLDGFNALAGGRTGNNGSAGPRLQRGPAYGEDVTGVSGEEKDWPTYRGNGRRSGYTPAKLGDALSPGWKCSLRPPLSGVTVARGRLFVAEKEHRAVVALDTDTGEMLWQYTAGGPVDSPPTVSDGRAVFGCADGWVYCLNAREGELVWRFRVAPRDARMMADGTLESVWPVHGSVLVQDGEVIAAAGRSSYLDGGFRVFRLDLNTGRVIEKKVMSHEQLTDPEILRAQDAAYDCYHMEGAETDLLLARGESIYLKTLRIFGDEEAAENEPLLVSHAGFLDGSLFERAFWFLSAGGRERLMGAQLIAHDRESAFGFRAHRRPSRGGGWHAAGEGYTLFKMSCEAGAGENGEGNKDLPYIPFQPRLRRDFGWKKRISVRARAMVLAGNALLVAGTPDVVQQGQDPLAAIGGRLGGTLVLFSRADGKILTEQELDAAPVWGGMAVADGRVYVATKDGSLVCLRSGEARARRTQDSSQVRRHLEAQDTVR